MFGFLTPKKFDNFEKEKIELVAHKQALLIERLAQIEKNIDLIHETLRNHMSYHASIAEPALKEIKVKIKEPENQGPVTVYSAKNKTYNENLTKGVSLEELLNTPEFLELTSKRYDTLYAFGESLLATLSKFKSSKKDKKRINYTIAVAVLKVYLKLGSYDFNSALQKLKYGQVLKNRELRTIRIAAKRLGVTVLRGLF